MLLCTVRRGAVAAAAARGYMYRMYGPEIRIECTPSYWSVAAEMNGENDP